jgi:hypothetical protein
VNLTAISAIYRFEMARAGRTLMQSIISPVLSTSLYFVVSAQRSDPGSNRSKASSTVRSSCRASSCCRS